MQTEKPTREEALAIAAERKAARHARNGRIRRLTAAIAIAAFIGPFGAIYMQFADGQSPASPATQQVVASTAAASNSSSEASSTTTTSTTSRSKPAAVTTQQS